MAKEKKVELTEESLGDVAGGAGKKEKKDTKVDKTDDKKTTPKNPGNVYHNDNRGGKQVSSQQGEKNKNESKDIKL